jgi:hypothetical protein
MKGSNDSNSKELFTDSGIKVKRIYKASDLKARKKDGKHSRV